MAKGNDGNYLQHCIEVEAATRLTQMDTEGRLHIAFTHGMKPFEKFEKLEKPNRSAKRLLKDALLEASSESHQSKERQIVTAYRKTSASKDRYPNSAELLRAVIGTDRLSGGITELDCEKHKILAEAWTGSNVDVAHSSWRKQLGPKGVLRCPDRLNVPWIFSMDPMTYKENGCADDCKLYRSDIDLLAYTLRRYVGSGQPGFACLFVYKMGIQRSNAQLQFWAFMDDLAKQIGVRTCSYWVLHQGGDRNLCGLLYPDKELSFGFVPPRLKPGRGKRP